MMMKMTATKNLLRGDEESLRKVKAQVLGTGRNQRRVEFHEVDIRQPSTIKLYNKVMPGTDTGDQKGSYYRWEHQSRFWTHRIFSHFLMLAIVNANILYNWSRPRGGNTTLTLLQFIKQVILDLIKEGKSTPEKPAEDPEDDDVQYLAKRRKSIATRKEEEDLRLSGQGGHTPGMVKRVMGENGKQKDIRVRCKCCQNKTAYHCVECDQFLCLFNGTGEHSCWWRFHNIKGEDMLKLTAAELERIEEKKRKVSGKKK